MADSSTKICVRAFLSHCVARFSVPATLTCDVGKQFVSELWRKTAALLGASTNAKTAYHPQANGMVQRLHRTMKACLKAKLGAELIPKGIRNYAVLKHVNILDFSSSGICQNPFLASKSEQSCILQPSTDLFDGIG